MEDLVSVIVPVYKVEEYLEECIESIINQTYKNIEIILVDDGSPDNCGEICEKYAEKDNRIKVFHKENGGLSDARNYGIERAKGDYISFIDSDDIVESNFIEILFKLMKEYNADIAVSPYQKFTDKKELFTRNRNKSIKVCNSEQALELMLYQNEIFDTSAHCKLYKINLFKDIKYPVGLYYEDLATTYKLYIKSKVIVGTSEKMYGYRMRQESIMHQKYSPKMLSCISISEKLYDDIFLKYPNLYKAAASRAFSVNRAIFLHLPYDKKEEKSKVWEKIKKFRKIVVLDKKARKRERIAAILSYLGKRIFSLFSGLYRRSQMKG